MPVLDLGEPLPEQDGGLLHMLEEARLQDHVEHRVARRRSERIAAEGRAVRAGRHALGRLGGAKHGADRKAAAEPLGQPHHVGRHAAKLVAEQVSEPADAGLHLVKRQQQTVLVAQRPQRAEELRRRRADAALALHRLDQDAGGLGSDRALHRLDVAERHLIEAVHHRPEAVDVLRVLGRGERRQRAAVERAFEGDDAVALRTAIRRLVLAHHLDDAFHRLGAGVGEEHRVGEACGAQPVGQPLPLGDAVEVGDVQHLGGLLGDRCDEVRMRMAERIDRDARREIEIALAVGRNQPSALAPLECEVDARIGWQHMRSHGPLTPARTLLPK